MAGLQGRNVTAQFITVILLSPILGVSEAFFISAGTFIPRPQLVRHEGFPFSSNGESGGLSTIYTRRRSQHQRLQQYTRLRASATSQSDTPPGAIPLEPSVVPSSSSSKSHPIPSSQENPLGDDGSGSEGNGEGRDVGDSQAPSSDNDSRGASRYRSKRRRKGQQAGAVASRLSWIRGLFGRTSQRAVSFLTIMTTWILFRILLQGFNKVKCHGRETLLEAVLDRKDQGLLTVSNHMCIYDDPGLWSALIPFWKTGRKKMRWAMCTDDIYNASPTLRGIFDAGRTLPIKRSRGMEQPLFKAFFDKLEEGEWGHIFAEGGIRQPWRFSRGTPILGDFKAGIGRLLLRSEHLPMVVPMYHVGMHQVAPEAPVQKRGRGKLAKMLPNIGRTVRVYVGEPIDVAPVIKKCRERIGDVRKLPWTDRSSKDEIQCHQEIAAYVREHVLKLEAVARKDYFGDDPTKSPYATGE